MNTSLTRRDFLKSAGALGAAAAFPTIIPASVLGANAPSKRVALGHIGVGGQGGGVMSGMLGLPQGTSVAVCDPFKERRERAAKQVEQRYADRVRPVAKKLAAPAASKPAARKKKRTTKKGATRK